MKGVLIFLSTLLLAASLNAQTVGVNLQSQFVIKGIQLYKTPVLGGYFEYNSGYFTGTAVVTYSIDGVFAEHLAIAKLSSSVWYVALTDYFYPYPANRFGNFAGRGKGSHVFELSGGYNLSGFELMASSNIYNDTTWSQYIQGAYRTKLSPDAGDFTCFVGCAVGDGYFYNTTKSGLHPIFCWIPV